MYKNQRFSSLVWIKNDLRVRDNPALSFASHKRGPAIAVYVIDEKIYTRCYGGERSLKRLREALKGFQSSLHSHGIPLLIRMGNTIDEIQKQVRELRIDHVCWNESLEPEVLFIEQELQKQLSKEAITIEIFSKNLLFDHKNISTKKGSVYKLFTPFWKASQALLQEIQETPLPKKQAILLSPPSLCSEEEKAWEQATAFVHNQLLHYSTHRDILGEERTSRLSAHIHFGEMSVRSLYLQTHEQPEFVRQLVWREFAHYLLHHFPETAQRPFHKEFIRFPWRRNANELKSWQNGHTGIPLVDAAMRQLLQTGWMPNRARMIAASFLTKHLLHHWLEGQDWFWDNLFDADLANNSFGWQWVAGCGVDAQPFFRILNPVLQGKRFDADGQYVKTYVPELANLPARWIHCPWDAPPSLLHSCGITLGKTYPYPLISLEEGRKRGLATFREYTRCAHLI